MDVRDSVRRRWYALCEVFGVDQATAASTGTWLLDAYAAPNRHYHDLRHIRECLDVIDERDLAPPVRLAAETAIFFHDVVYDTTADDNEHRSALAAGEFLERIGRTDLVEPVIEAIEMTAGHVPSERSALLDAVHDADLAILGAPPERYDDYARAIRVEYAHVPDDDFASGRARVLRSFLAQPRLYLGPDMDDRERAARTNLGRELAALGDGA